jgi:hypothetical protein
MLTKKDAGMFEPPKAVSSQRPVNSEKYPSRGYKLQVSAAGGQDSWGALFVASLLVRFWANKNEQIK